MSLELGIRGTVCVIYCHSKVFMDQATGLFNLICSLSDLRLCVFVCVCYVCFN